MARLIAIGDVHGEITLLLRLIAALKLQPEDELVLLGDYIDRGEDSKATVEYLMELAKRPNTKLLMGNHEQMLFDAIDDPDGDAAHLWLYHGGSKTSADYDGYVPVEHEQFLRSLPLWYRSGRFVFVHAGLHPHRPILPQLAVPDPDVMLWERDHLKPGEKAWEDGLTVVCGHTVVPHPIVTPSLVCLDTGACHGGGLTAIDLTNHVTYRAMKGVEVRIERVREARTPELSQSA